MKDERKQCKKHHESTIGKIIYGFLMFMPLLAIATTCLYTIFNKNAYKSYGDKEITTTTILNNSNINDLYVNGQIVTLKWNDVQYGSRSGKFGFSNISIDLNNLLNTQNVNYKSFEFYTSSNDWIYFFDVNESQYTLYNYKNILPDGFSYTVDLSTYTRTGIYNYSLPSITTYINASLSDVFYYSIKQTENSNLFNWAKDSVIYTGMHDFTTQLNVSNTFMPMLLSYWLIVSIIYFLYDIILLILNIIHRKIHELQDSL